MTKDEFGKLNLFEVLFDEGLLCRTKSGGYRSIAKKKALDFLQRTLPLEDPFDSYEELLFCILNGDWPLDHTCLNCGKRIPFSVKDKSRYDLYCCRRCCAEKLNSRPIEELGVDPSIEGRFDTDFGFEEFRDFYLKNILGGRRQLTPKLKKTFAYFSERVGISKRWRSVGEFMWCIAHNEPSVHEYCSCGKEVVFVEGKGRLKTCGGKLCQERFAHTEQSYVKRKQTCTDRYDVDHYSKTAAYKAKVGASSYMKNSEEKRKWQESYFKKTGYCTPLSNPEVRKKIASTVEGKLKENSNYRKDIARKAVESYRKKDPRYEDRNLKTKATIEKKLESNPNYWKDISEKAYGTKYANAGSKERYFQYVKDKTADTISKRHTSYDDFCENKRLKTIQTFRNLYGLDSYRSTEEFRKKYFEQRQQQLEDFKNANPDVQSIDDLVAAFDYVFSKYGFVDFRKKLLLEKSLSTIGYSVETFNFGNGDNSKKFRGCRILDFEAAKDAIGSQLSIDCGLFLKDKFRSKSEEELAEFVCSLIPDEKIVFNDRSAIRNENGFSYELDIYVPGRNIAIEYNGLYWHSSEHNNDNRYHLDKTLACERRGIRLIHLWEHEWLFDTQKMKGFLTNVFSAKIHLGARKCVLKKVDPKEEKRFLNEHHLQGYRKSLVCYGLFYEGGLAQIMSFSKPRYRKSAEYELLRLCTVAGVIVQGGAERLLHAFKEEYHPTSIVSYCNRDKFEGDVYTRLGFEGENIVPSVFYVRLGKNGYESFSASSLNALGADRLLGTDFGKGTANRQIVLDHGYREIHGVGQQAFVFNEPPLEKQEVSGSSGQE